MSQTVVAFINQQRAQRWSAAVVSSSTPFTVFSEALLVAPGLHVDSKYIKACIIKQSERSEKKRCNEGFEALT